MTDFDSSGACNAMLSQFRSTIARVAVLGDKESRLPTRLGSWRVIELVAHLIGSLELLVRSAAAPSPDVGASSPLRWYRNVDEFATAIDDEARSIARAGWTAVRLRMAQRLAEVSDLLDDEDPRLVVGAGSDVLTLEGLCVTRCVEVVLHTLDLCAALDAPLDVDTNALTIARRFVELADNGAGLVRPELFAARSQ